MLATAGSSSRGLNEALPVTLELEWASMVSSTAEMRTPWFACENCESEVHCSSEQEVQTAQKQEQKQV